MTSLTKGISSAWAADLALYSLSNKSCDRYWGKIATVALHTGNDK